MKTLTLFLILVFFCSLMSAAPLCHRVSAVNGKSYCPHQAQVDEWVGWRTQNPHAHSRYPHGDKVHFGILSLFNFASSFEAMDEEPAPDPSFGGCGCDEATALASGGCGWWHANVYNITRSFYGLKVRR